MEGMDWGALLEQALPLVLGVAGALLVTGFGWLRRYVALTPNKVDDMIMKEFDEAWEHGRTEGRLEAESEAKTNEQPAS